MRRLAAATVTAPVASTGASITLLAARTTREHFVIENNSTARLYVKFGATASSSDYTFSLAQYDKYESPSDGCYTGIITGLQASGSAMCTEVY